jgi:hypothetical protein
MILSDSFPRHQYKARHPTSHGFFPSDERTGGVDVLSTVYQSSNAMAYQVRLFRMYKMRAGFTADTAQP